MILGKATREEWACHFRIKSEFPREKNLLASHSSSSGRYFRSFKYMLQLYKDKKVYEDYLNMIDFRCVYIGNCVEVDLTFIQGVSKIYLS